MMDNKPEDLSRQQTTKDKLRSRIVTQDSFADDFNFKKMKTSLSMTMSEGKLIKEEALKKA